MPKLWAHIYSMKLKLAFCDHKAAKLAVQNWHYSKTMPAGKLVKIGVWENDLFVGVVIFGRGANNHLAQSLKCDVTECCELVRIALRKHETPVTKIVAIALKMLKRTNPGIKVVASYADKTNQQHQGIIYKAGNWQYHGIRTATNGHFLIDGKIVHNRSISSKFGSRDNIPDAFKEKMLKAPPQEKHFFTYNLR